MVKRFCFFDIEYSMLLFKYWEVPAFAGMTNRMGWRGGSRLRGNDKSGERDEEIPASAGICAVLLNTFN